jgi:hypothetical protein
MGAKRAPGIVSSAASATRSMRKPRRRSKARYLALAIVGGRSKS